MILQHVTYQVFEHEIAGHWTIEPNSWHQLDGEIILGLSDGNSQFFSWGSGPVQYSIEQRGSSFFNSGKLTAIAMSEHPYWKEMVGREIRTEFVDENHQVLQISGGNQCVFLSSQYDDGMFQGDCVRVSKTNPL